MQSAPFPRPAPSDGLSSRERLRICVIGAGCCGLTSLKALLEAGHQVTAYELGSRVGGLWVFDSDSGRSAAYRSLRINTSRQEMEFRDFPMPEDFGDYPTHERIAEYFQSYAEHFGLHSRIRFQHRVEQCRPTDRGYEVQSVDLKTGESRLDSFDALIVASGHHWSPAFPARPDPQLFDGKRLHSHDYRDTKTPVDLHGKRVVVVGFGNSAVDIATEAASVAERVSLSTRRGAWVLPRYLLGKPIDQGQLIPGWLPPKLRRRIVTACFRAIHGGMKRHGLPEPDHLIGEAHPTMSDTLPQLVSSGRVQMRGQITEIAGRTLRYASGETEEADVLLYSTGYRVRFPFFDDTHITAPENDLPLFRRVFHPKHRRVFFIGLAQTLGAIMPTAELQAQWVAAHLAGSYRLPDPPELEKDIAAEAEQRAKRYVTSQRHTMQLDPRAYAREFKRELARGQHRARNGTGQSFDDE